MSNLYGVAGVNNPQYLLASPEGQDVIGVNLKPGQGAVARGTVLYKNGEMYEAADAAAIIETNDLVVCDEAVDTDENPGVAEVARAYRAGHLLAGRVKAKDGSAVTAAQALILRKQGIVLDIMDQGAPVVNNQAGQ